MLKDEALLDPAAHKPVMRSLVQLVRFLPFALSSVTCRLWLHAVLSSGYLLTGIVPFVS
jgi:hypothetical protein